MDAIRIDMDESPVALGGKTMKRDAGPRPTFQIRGHRHVASDLPRHWIVLPPQARERALQHPLLRGLLPTHIGFFPCARNHRADRPSGVEQAVFTYCVRGSGFWQVEGRRVDVKPGDLIVVPPRTAHAYASNPERPWTVHWFHAAGAHVNLILRELGLDPLRPVIPIGQDGALVALFQDLEEALEQDYAFPQLLYASQILGHLVGLMIRLRRKRASESPNAGERVLLSARQMKERFDRPLDVAQWASFANLSISHYASLFRRLLGSSPKAYFDRMRLHRAAGLLVTTHESVQTIATRTGYKDPLYFSRTFRRVHGVSPSDYRRGNRPPESGS
jgi:AraC-like DNA-binding protein